MAHRTLNPRTAFWLDARESAEPKRKPKHDKGDVGTAWAQEFPGVPLPHYWGSLPREVYPKLTAAGWKFSSRYGWRKSNA